MPILTWYSTSMPFWPRPRFMGKDTARCGQAALWAPKCIREESGPEFFSEEVDLWAYAQGVVLHSHPAGESTDNALIESFKSRVRQECLNEHWFLSLEDAKKKIAVWRPHYNGHRPHSSLGYQSPLEYLSGALPPPPRSLTPPEVRLGRKTKWASVIII
jgi:putative transposase